MIKAFLFDRDGIILDSEYSHVKAVKKAFKILGIKITKNDENKIIGRHPDNYLPELKKKYNFSKEDFLKIETKLYYKYFNRAPLFKEAINLVSKLKKKGYKIGLTTTSDMKTTEMLFKRVKNLRKNLDVVIVREDYKKNKPDAEPYLITAKKLKILPNECVVIEDSPTGLKSAKNAGMRCIIILTNLTKKQNFNGADLIVKSAKNINLKKIIF